MCCSFFVGFPVLGVVSWAYLLLFRAPCPFVEFVDDPPLFIPIFALAPLSDVQVFCGMFQFAAPPPFLFSISPLFRFSFCFRSFSFHPPVDVVAAVAIPLFSPFPALISYLVLVLLLLLLLFFSSFLCARRVWSASFSDCHGVVG